MIDQTSRPILKSQVFFAEVEGGVYFNGGSEKTFVLRGKGIYPIVSRLVQALNGSNTVGQLTAGLPEKLRPLLVALLQELSSRRLLAEMNRAPDTIPVSAFEEGRYGDVLSYLRDNVDDFGSAFATLRSTRIRAIGGGYAMKSFLRSAARLGVGHIEAAQDGREFAQPGWGEVVSALDDQATADENFQFGTFVAADALEDEDGGNGWTVYVHDDLDLTTLLGSLTARRNSRFLVAGVFGNEGVVGPEQAEGSATFRDLAERLRGTTDVRHTIVSKSVIGNLAALELMRTVLDLPRARWSGEDAKLKNWVLHVTPGPAITRRPVMPVPTPGGPPPQPVALRVPAEEAGEGEPTPRQLLEEKLRVFYDPYTGVFEKTGEDLSQLPLAQAAVRVKFPAGFGEGDATVFACATDLMIADEEAILKAVARYANGVAHALDLPGAGDFSADSDEERWRRHALAAALLRYSPLLDKAYRFAVDADALDDPASRVMIRMSSLYTDDKPRIGLLRLPGFAASTAHVSLGGKTATATAESAALAIRGALSELCGAFQRGAQDALPDAGRAFAEEVGPPADADVRLTTDTDDAAALAGMSLEAVPVLFDRDPVLASSGLIVGCLYLKPAKS